jgi:hypothetical protein
MVAAAQKWPAASSGRRDTAFSATAQPSLPIFVRSEAGSSGSSLFQKYQAAERQSSP